MSQSPAWYKSYASKFFTPIAYRTKNRSDRRDLDAVIDLLPIREKALLEAISGLKNLNVNLEMDQLFALAATDVFVEKAQRVLTRRAIALYVSGGIAIFVTVVILIAATLFIAHQLNQPVDEKIIQSTRALILRLFQATALSAFVLAAVKLLVSLTRSFFHEALSLFERRHALRFGRLYVYLKKGAITDKRLEEAFQWNKESRTSFLDLKPEVVAETILHKAFETVSKLPPETIKAAFSATSRKKKITDPTFPGM